MTQLKQIEQSFIGRIPVRFSLNECGLRYIRVFYKKLGSASDTKSFLISRKTFGIPVQKSFLISFLFSRPKFTLLFES